jgi:hypothetical protein
MTTTKNRSRRIYTVSTETGPTGSNFITESVRDSNAYSVVKPDGTQVAKSHRVNAKLDMWTVVINGKWVGVVTEAKAIKTLKGLI